MSTMFLHNLPDKEKPKLSLNKLSSALMKQIALDVKKNKSKGEKKSG
ncbi:hypothetical protein ABFT51_03235 [Paenibacillus peoriae]